MKIAVITGLVLVSLLGLFLMVSEPSDSSTQSNVLNDNDTSLTTFESDIASGTPLIDTRTPEEFNESHILNAINLPLDRIQAGAEPNATKDEKIYLYCRSGNRSAEAKKILEDAGYINIVDLGGMNEVVALGASLAN
jgi:phage shock protein E